MTTIPEQPADTQTRNTPSLAPIAPSKRIEVLDVLRGIALIGIVFMNIEWFGRSSAELGSFDTTLTGVDHATGWLVRCFVEGKFYKLFALLFGMGFAVMLLRAQEAGRPFGAWFTRRMVVLFAIGMIHTIFIWNGDILHDYAIAGLVFLLWIYAFRTQRLRRFNKPGTFLKIGLVWLVLPVFAAGIVGMVFSLRTDNAGLEEAWATDQEVAAVAAERLEEPVPDDYDFEAEEPDDNGVDDSELSDEERKELRIEKRVRSERRQEKRSDDEVTLLSSGSYLEATKFRLSKIPQLLSQSLVFTAIVLVPIFLVGYWFIFSGVLREHRQHGPLFRSMAWIGLVAGFALSVGGLMILQHPAAEISRTLIPVGGTIFFLSQYLMSAGYLAAIVLLSDTRLAHSAYARLAPFGRMALTNYIMQSVVMAALFYNTGAGFYGQITRAQQMFAVVAIVAVQVMYSNWWLKRFRFGPLEWLWRSATYLSLQPMRNAESS